MYWQRKFRLEALEQMESSAAALPVSAEGSCVPVFTDVTEKLEELQGVQETRKYPGGLPPITPELMIQVGAYQIYVNGSIQMTTLEKVMRVMSRA